MGYLEMLPCFNPSFCLHRNESICRLEQETENKHLDLFIFVFCDKIGNNEFKEAH